MRHYDYSPLEGPQSYIKAGRVILCKGGGGSSGNPYYANQDKLFGAQADIAQELFNQYADVAPQYIANSEKMVGEAMDGTLATRARNTAAGDANASMGAGVAATTRNLARYGAEFNPSQVAASGRVAALEGAKLRTGAMNQANAWAEDQKWNRNAGAFGQIAGMGTGAMSGMGSAAAGYGGMASSQGSMSAANAQGFGKLGAAIAGGTLGYADGGSVRKMKKIDWRSMPTSAPQSSGGGAAEALGMVAMGAAPGAINLGIKDLLSNNSKLAKFFSKTKSEFSTKVKPEVDGTNTETFQVDQSPNSTVGYSGSESLNDIGGNVYGGDSSNVEVTPVPDQNNIDDFGLDFGYASGYASGGSIQKIDADNFESDPYKFRQEGPGVGDRLAASAGAAATNPLTYVGAYNQYNKAMKADFDKQVKTPSDPGYTGSEAFGTQQGASYDTSAQAAADRAEFSVPNETSAANVGEPVNAPAQVTDTGAKEFSDAFNGSTAPVDESVINGATDVADTADAASSAADGADGASGSVPYMSVAKGVLDIANGRDVGESVADAALAYGGAEAGAALGTAVLPGVGTVVGGVLGGLLGGSIFKDGGDVEREDHTAGGEVSGPGTETSDDIPAWLSDGEFVINADAVKIIGKDKLEAINDAGLEKRQERKNQFACGGAIKHGVKMAGGGFLGGNLGIALGAGADSFDQQQQRAQRKAELDRNYELQKANSERLGKLSDLQIEEAKSQQADKKAMKEAQSFANERISEANALQSDLINLPARVKSGELTQAEADAAKGAYQSAASMPNDLVGKAGSAVGKLDIAKGMALTDAAQKDLYQSTFRDLTARNAPIDEQLNALGNIDPKTALTLRTQMKIAGDKSESAAGIAQLRAESKLNEAILRAELKGVGSGYGSSGGKANPADTEGLSTIDAAFGKDVEIPTGEKTSVKGVELAPAAKVLYNDLRVNGYEPARAAHRAIEITKHQHGIAGAKYAPAVSIDDQGGYTININNANGSMEKSLYKDVANPADYISAPKDKQQAQLSSLRASAADAFAKKHGLNVYDLARLSEKDIENKAKEKASEGKDTSAMVAQLKAFSGHAKEYARLNPESKPNENQQTTSGETWDTFDEANLYRLGNIAKNGSKQDALLAQQEIAKLQEKKKSSRPSMMLRMLNTDHSGKATADWN